MARAKTLFEEALDAWSYARDGVIAEAENIPAAQYAFKPAGGSRTVAELIQHIVEAGMMAAGELPRADGSFERQSYPEFIREYAGSRTQVSDREALLDLLRATHGEALARLREAGEKRLLEPIVQFNGEPATRLTWLHHAIGHEEYHRGQLALYARLLGRVPALTKLIAGG